MTTTAPEGRAWTGAPPWTPPDQDVRAPSWAMTAAVFGIAAVGLALAGATASWTPLWLLAALWIAVIALDAWPVWVGNIRYLASDLPIWLAVVYFGAVPAVLIAASGVVFDAAMRRVPVSMAAHNVALTVGAPALGAGLLAVSGPPMAPGALAGLVMVLLVLLDLLAFCLVVITNVDRPRLLPALRGMFLPVLPWTVITAVFTGAAILAAAEVGNPAVVLVLGLQGVVLLLLKGVEREQRNSVEVGRLLLQRDRLLEESLRAGEVERARVAAHLHDDALQHLLSARQDIAEGIAGQADRLDRGLAHLTEGIQRLRAVARERLPAARTGALAMEELDALCRDAGITLSVDASLHPHQTTDPLVGPIVRELVLNAIKHAGASAVQVRIFRRDRSILLEVEDDGRGIDSALRAQRRRAGHLGLELIARQAEHRGGSFSIRSGPSAGTLAVVSLPQPAG